MKAKDLTVLLGVIGIVLMMILPIPVWLLDVLLIVNISIALTIILVAMNTKDPLQFSIFPSLLLITTLFRLALNISTTKLILKDGHAGEVVATFGSWIAGGQIAIGFIVFLILVVVQFIVITKGSERVAEVGARFTLDAMPGKQMSIDADLNAGMINEQQARERRRNVEREADFFGAMDGASKFVKGDAIASIIILLINLIGGFVIGMTIHGLSFQEALSTYSVLTIGDGLVSQIPALLISTASGLIVTRAASEGNTGRGFDRPIIVLSEALVYRCGDNCLPWILHSDYNNVYLAYSGTHGICGLQHGPEGKPKTNGRGTTGRGEAD